MNAYDIGSEDEVVAGPFIATPGYMKAEMETVETAVKQLEMDVRAANVRPAFKSAFTGFVTEWRKFYKEHQGWTDRLWGATADKIADFRSRAEQWRQALINEGGQALTPTITSVPTPTASSTSMKTAAWLGGGLIAAWALASVASMKRS